VLARYFAYSIEEGRTLGRTVHLADPSQGVAVWLLPQPDEIQSSAAERKRLFLTNTLGARGTSNYYRMVEYMSGKAQKLVSDDAWYLSIIAVDPSLQGRGLGQQLLAPTLAEIDASDAISYLETFGPRSVTFYERLGFRTVARFDEPTTEAQYALMVRKPRAPHA
jgi:GNAT superfamily N-acetyltransferase